MIIVGEVRTTVYQASYRNGWGPLGNICDGIVPNAPMETQIVQCIGKKPI